MGKTLEQLWLMVDERFVPSVDDLANALTYLAQAERERDAAQTIRITDDEGRRWPDELKQAVKALEDEYEVELYSHAFLLQWVVRCEGLESSERALRRELEAAKASLSDHDALITRYDADLKAARETIVQKTREAMAAKLEYTRMAGENARLNAVLDGVRELSELRQAGNRRMMELFKELAVAIEDDEPTPDSLPVLVSLIKHNLKRSKEAQAESARLSADNLAWETAARNIIRLVPVAADSIHHLPIDEIVATYFVPKATQAGEGIPAALATLNITADSLFARIEQELERGNRADARGLLDFVDRLREATK